MSSAYIRFLINNKQQRSVDRAQARYIIQKKDKEFKRRGGGFVNKKIECLKQGGFGQKKNIGLTSDETERGFQKVEIN